MSLVLEIFYVIGEILAIIIKSNVLQQWLLVLQNLLKQNCYNWCKSV